MADNENAKVLAKVAAEAIKEGARVNALVVGHQQPVPISNADFTQGLVRLKRSDGYVMVLDPTALLGVTFTPLKD